MPQLAQACISRTEVAVATTDGKEVSARAQAQQAEAFSSVWTDMRQPVSLTVGGLV